MTILNISITVPAFFYDPLLHFCMYKTSESYHIIHRRQIEKYF